jgi:fido (protein-threonine AMPylation protein)
LSRQPWEVGEHPQRWQGYLDPDKGILRNLVGAQSLEQLHVIEDNLVEARTIGLLENPVQGHTAFPTSRESIATCSRTSTGELRTVNME